MSNEGQEWEPIEPSGIRAGKLLFIEVDSDFPYEPLEAQVALHDRILADHRDAQQLREHGFIPDIAVDHDAPVCELCGEGAEVHTYWSTFAEDAFKQFADSAERVRVLEEALRDILGYLSGPNGLDVPADYKQGGEAIWRFADRALSSPIATEGEGA